MAPRPAFLSSLGSKGFPGPSKNFINTRRIDPTDVSGFSTMGQQDRSKPPQLTPAKGITPPFQSIVPSVDQIFQKKA